MALKKVLRENGTQIFPVTRADCVYMPNNDNSTLEAYITSALSSKADIDHPHNYAGSETSGGAANTAVKLDRPVSITVGSVTKSFDGSENISFTLNEIGVSNSEMMTAEELEAIFKNIGI